MSADCKDCRALAALTTAADLEAELAAVVEAIRAVEWNGEMDRPDTGYYRYCHICGADQRAGHKPECKIGQALSGLGARRADGLARVLAAGDRLERVAHKGVTWQELLRAIEDVGQAARALRGDGARRAAGE
jgi:hypothetical protein